MPRKPPAYLVDISGVDKAALLAALMNHPFGAGHPLTWMTPARAQQIIDSGLADGGFKRGGGPYDEWLDWRGTMYFDYVRGHRVKMNLGGNFTDPRWFEEEAGVGTVQAIVDALRGISSSSAAR